MSVDSFGQWLPGLRTEIPGPESRALATRLALVESRNITCLEPRPPIFWSEAHGANVRDVDGNVYIDLTAGFGAASAGHSNRAVVHALAHQAEQLAHGLGDVHPPAIKVELLEKLAAITPGPLAVSILGSAGAEAVEAALKTAWLRTGRPTIVAFEGSYHGLTAGALAVTHRLEFRTPFLAVLNPHVRFVPFPHSETDLPTVLGRLDAALDDSVGAVLVEPIQGRGGMRVPPVQFLPALRARCNGRQRLLIFDEIYTGMGRTGAWFACEHSNVVPDLLVLGKGLTGSVPLSACIGTADVMAAWPPSQGEAIHTSTFLGNPIACAAALAQIEELLNLQLIPRAHTLGEKIQKRARQWSSRWPVVQPARGMGALQGVPLSASKPGLAQAICARALARGIILLAEGPEADVLALTPPLVVTDAQLEHALTVIECSLEDCLL
jgi:4-aminobutyrate aminotransferase/(S)-3-amino-2-methylpropionate transaminase